MEKSKLKNMRQIKKKRVLVIETNETIGKVYKTIFSREKRFNVRVEHDLRQAVAAALAFKPDLILLGVHFPKDRDLEIVKILRDRSDVTRAPIAVLCLGREFVSEKYMRAGVRSVIDVSRLPLEAIVQKIRNMLL